jgi:hypothetical protein
MSRGSADERKNLVHPDQQPYVYISGDPVSRTRAGRHLCLQITWRSTPVGRRPLYQSDGRCRGDELDRLDERDLPHGKDHHTRVGR